MAFISLTRIRVRSFRYMPGFVWFSIRSSWQARHAPGFLGMRLLADRRLTFWTATAWQDVAAMKAYRSAGSHGAAMRYLAEWSDEASYTRWLGPVASMSDWSAAHARMLAEGVASRVTRPSAAQLARAWDAPRLQLRLVLPVAPARNR